MRSKIPCNACGKTSCPSSKCVCKVCYNRQKRFEKVSAFREATTKTAEELLPPAPVVINLEGMSKYCLENEERLYVNFMKSIVLFCNEIIRYGALFSAEKNTNFPPHLLVTG